MYATGTWKNGGINPRTGMQISLLRVEWLQDNSEEEEEEGQQQWQRQDDSKEEMQVLQQQQDDDSDSGEGQKEQGKENDESMEIGNKLMEMCFEGLVNSH